MKKICLSFMLLLFVSALSAAGADVYMKQSVKTDSFQMMGRTQPAQEQTVDIWMSSQKMKTDTPKQTVLFRLDQKKMYFIDNARKTFSETPINMSEMADQMAEQDSEMDAEEREAFTKFFKGMTQMTITVEATGETKTIGSWNCSKYIQTVNSVMGPITSEVWATEDLDVDTDLFAQTNAAMLAMQTGGQENAQKTLSELEKIKGVPVLTTTTTNMMGAAIKSTTELVECKNQQAPSGTFDLPKGYKKTAMGGPMGGGA